MDLGPQTDVYPCPECGVDAARAMVVSAVVAFYRPTFKCRVCGLVLATLQAGANHMATHEPNLGAFVNNWINTHEPRYEVRRKDP